jgi:Excalibur calcium-binding domain
VPGPSGPACPGGYAQQLIQVQAIPAGATDPTWVQVAACVAPVVQLNVTPTPTPTPTSSVGLHPRFPTCAAVKTAGYGPYHVTVDPEYWWYTDADHDGWVCE